MHETYTAATYADLMEKIYELVTVCGGWDAECRNVKPGVEEQLESVTHAVRQILGYDPTIPGPEDAA